MRLSNKILLLIFYYIDEIKVLFNLLILNKNLYNLQLKYEILQNHRNTSIMNLIKFSRIDLLNKKDDNIIKKKLYRIMEEICKTNNLKIFNWLANKYEHLIYCHLSYLKHCTLYLKLPLQYNNPEIFNGLKKITKKSNKLILTNELIDTAFEYDRYKLIDYCINNDINREYLIARLLELSDLERLETICPSQDEISINTIRILLKKHDIKILKYLVERYIHFNLIMEHFLYHDKKNVIEKFNIIPKNIPLYNITNALEYNNITLVNYYKNLGIRRDKFIEHFSIKKNLEQIENLFPLNKNDITKKSVDIAKKNGWLKLLSYYGKIYHSSKIYNIFGQLNEPKRKAKLIPYIKFSLVDEKIIRYVIENNMDDIIDYCIINKLYLHLFIEDETSKNNKDKVLSLISSLSYSDKVKKHISKIEVFCGYKATTIQTRDFLINPISSLKIPGVLNITQNTIHNTIINKWYDILDLYSKYNLTASRKSIDLMLENDYPLDKINKFNNGCTLDKLIKLVNNKEYDIVIHFITKYQNQLLSEKLLDILIADENIEAITLLQKYCIQSENVVTNFIKSGNTDLINMYNIKITPNILNCAVEHNRIKLVKHFYQNNKFDINDNSLIIICREGCYDMVKFLLNQKVKFPSDSVTVSAQNNNFNIMILLLSNNYKPTFECVEYAIIYGKLDMVILVASYGFEFTSYHIELAKQYEYIKIVDYITNLAPVLKEEPINESKFLDYVFEQNIDNIKLLLERDFNVDDNILDIVLNYGNEDIINLILAYK